MYIGGTHANSFEKLEGNFKTIFIVIQNVKNKNKSKKWQKLNTHLLLSKLDSDNDNLPEICKMMFERRHLIFFEDVRFRIRRENPRDEEVVLTQVRHAETAHRPGQTQQNGDCLITKLNWK